jgi:hypothetical protein
MRTLLTLSSALRDGWQTQKTIAARDEIALGWR